MKSKKLATSQSFEGIIKLISEYFYGSQITLHKNNDGYSVHNKKGIVNGYSVIEIKDRFIFIERVGRKDIENAMKSAEGFWNKED